MLKFDLDNENETIVNYRERIRQCEALGEFAMAEQIREILVQEQDHQIDLATALGEDVPDLSRLSVRRDQAEALISTGWIEGAAADPKPTMEKIRWPHKPLGCRAPNMAKFTIGPSCRKACLPFRASAKSR